MKTFRVVLTGQSALKIGKKETWRGENYQMTVRDQWTDAKEGHPPNHLGLIYTVELRSNDAFSSITQATGIARRLCDVLTAVHSAIIDHPQPQFAMDVEPNSSKRELVQVVSNCPLIHKPLREMDAQRYRPFFEKMDELRKSNSKMASRITRALYYFRHSLLHSDPIDSFEDAWVALEVLGPKIREKFNLPTKQSNKCEKCGEVIKNPYGTAGIDYIIETLLKEDAHSLREKRHGIQHGFSHLEEVLKDIRDYTEVARRGVIAGVCELLELPVDKGGGLSKQFLPIAKSGPMLISAFLHDFPIENLKEMGNYPQLEIQKIGKMVKTQKEEHGGQHTPLAMQVWVKVSGYTGSWDLQDASFDLVIDPDGSNPRPEMVLQKWNV